MKFKITSERLSDVVVGLGYRTDWSEVNERLRALQPGGGLVVECPVGKMVEKIRSTILMSARRIRYGDEGNEWRLKTHVEGRKVHCFLVPVGRMKMEG
jgi:hypothetical protein